MVFSKLTKELGVYILNTGLDLKQGKKHWRRSYSRR